MKYKLLVAYSDFQLNKDVNEYLDEGWELYGLPVMTSSTDGVGVGAHMVVVYAQAVTQELD